MVDVSVIIPLYKGQQYILYLMDIITKNFKMYQREYNGTCEVLFINDYPSEVISVDSEEISVRVFNPEKNQGIHGARVFGYKQAKGEYILFLDQDDKISEEYLLKQRKKIGDADFVVCNGYRERFCMRGKREIYAEAGRFDNVPSFAPFLDGNYIISPGQVLIKKESIPDIWLNNSLRYNGADDYFLWILMLKMGCICEINRECLYTHMEYDGNTGNNTEEMNLSLNEMVDILDKEKVLEANELEILSKNIITKSKNDSRYFRMVKVYDHWMYLSIRGIKTSKYFQGHGYRRIAIYGMNYIGNRLYDELYGDKNIEISFCIDRAAKGIVYDDIKVLTPDDKRLTDYLDKVDIIVVTAVASYREIFKDLKKKCNKPIVSIEEAIFELVNDFL